MLDGQVFTAAPHRVLRDTGDELLLAHWPGITALAPRTWIDWLHTGDDAVRKRALPDLAARTWELGDWVWRDTGRLSWFGVDEWFSLHRFFDLTGTPLNWYINFERPFVRTRSGVDTFDVMIDLVAAPDLSSWRWKDEDEYAELHRLGVLGNAEVRPADRGGPGTGCRTSGIARRPARRGLVVVARRPGLAGPGTARRLADPASLISDEPSPAASIRPGCRTRSRGAGPEGGDAR